MAGVSDVTLSVSTQNRVQALVDVVCSDISELYSVGKELGQGRFSTVHAGTSTGSGDRVALKVVDNASLEEDENLEALEQEVKILRMLDHPYVVRLREVVLAKSHTYICMELLGGGELFQKIVDAGRYSEEAAQVLFARLVVCVEFMHSVNIVHRDLKPENVLFVSGQGSMPNDIKVIDFGYAGLWSPAQELTGLCGTPDYVAPEILSWYADEDAGVAYGKPSDVWSLGVMLYVILSGCSPFAAEEEEALLKQVAAAAYAFPDREWKDVSDGAKDLIRRALVPEPEKRITLAEIRQHPWAKEALVAVDREVAAALEARKRKLASTARVTKASGHAGPCCTIQ